MAKRTKKVKEQKVALEAKDAVALTSAIFNMQLRQQEFEKQQEEMQESVEAITSKYAPEGLALLSVELEEALLVFGEAPAEEVSA